MHVVFKCCFHLLPCLSEGVKRSFKILSRVHSNSCGQLSDDKADKLSNIIHNAHQLRRIDNGMLATEYDSSILDLLT